jgi:di/tricarboxylate transporter
VQRRNVGCVAMVAFGVCSFSDILSGFGGMIVWLLFAMQIIGLAMFTTGAASMVGKLVIKLSKNDERRFILSHV